MTTDAPNQLPRNDHDTLIRLETKFDNFSTQVIGDIKELKDGTQARLILVEARLGAIEKVHDEVQPIETAKQVASLVIWRSNLEANLKFMLALSSAIGAVLGVISTILLIISHLISFK